MYDPRLEDRFGIAWNAATLMLQGDVDDALEVLASLAGPDHDDWSRCLRAGCNDLRQAQDEIRLAERLAREGRPADAKWHWHAAETAWEAASHVMDGIGEPPPLRHLPDPWPQIVDLFKDHMDDRHQENELAS